MALQTWGSANFGSGARKPVAPTAPSGPSPNPTYTTDSGNPLGGFSFGQPTQPTQQAAPPSFPAPTPAAPPVSNTPSFDSDPGVALARALENQGLGSLDAALKAQREQAIIQFGDPALASMAGFGLDPQAGVFAQQNYLSGNADLARLNRAKDLAKRAVINRLAARGLLRSGDLGYLEGQTNQEFGNQEYDLRQAVLNRLNEYANQYLGRSQGIKQNTLQAILDYYNRRANNPDLLTPDLVGSGGGAASPGGGGYRYGDVSSLIRKYFS